MKKRVHIIVGGRIQGVCYRAEAVDFAVGLGLTGWVANLPDGRVEAVAEGEDQNLEEFVAWCRQGPAMAFVREITVDWSPATGEFTTFDVRHGW